MCDCQQQQQQSPSGIPVRIFSRSEAGNDLFFFALNWIFLPLYAFEDLSPVVFSRHKLKSHWRKVNTEVHRKAVQLWKTSRFGVHTWQERILGFIVVVILFYFLGGIVRLLLSHVQQVSCPPPPPERPVSGPRSLRSWVHAVSSADLSAESRSRLRRWSDSGEGSVRMLRPVRPPGVGALRRTGLDARLLRPRANVCLLQQHRGCHNPGDRSM